VSGGIGSTLVTGGSVSPDGTVVALRTYTEAYLYRAPGGDIPAALRGKPVHIPLPNEVQGEAIAIEPDGTLLSASEGQRQPVRAVHGAVDLLPKAPSRAPSPAPRAKPKPEEPHVAPAHDADGPGKGQGLDTGPAILVAAGMTGLLLLAAKGIKRLRNRG
jgi:hypothetical protein